MSEYSVIMSTAGSVEDARALAKALIDAKLAACVQLLPIESLYTWNGEIAQEAETLMLIKTRAGLYEDVEAKIVELHSYETPEVLQLEVQRSSGSYLAWITAVT
jgi:periplasmic divalent cation tolerance protein